MKEYVVEDDAFIARHFESLSDGQGLLFDELRPTATIIYQFEPGHMEQLARDPSWFHVVGLAMRDCTIEFGHHLEYTYFIPDTPANLELKHRVLKWQGIPWSVFSVPLAKANTCYLAATATGNRLADGIPHTWETPGGVMGVGNMRQPPVGRPEFKNFKAFPLNTPQTFSVQPDHGHTRPIPAMVAVMKKPQIFKRRKSGPH